jgi:hypothetical protein
MRAVSDYLRRASNYFPSSRPPPRTSRAPPTGGAAASTRGLTLDAGRSPRSRAARDRTIGKAQPGICSSQRCDRGQAVAHPGAAALDRRERRAEGDPHQGCGAVRARLSSWLLCAGKTGVVLRMKESNWKGGSDPPGPESWASGGNVGGQALTGVHAGRARGSRNHRRHQTRVPPSHRRRGERPARSRRGPRLVERRRARPRRRGAQALRRLRRGHAARFGRSELWLAHRSRAGNP